MNVNDLIEEVATRFDNCAFFEIHVESGRLVVYGYTEDLVCERLRDYEHYSDIKMIEEPKDYVLED